MKQVPAQRGVPDHSYGPDQLVLGAPHDLQAVQVVNAHVQGPFHTQPMSGATGEWGPRATLSVAAGFCSLLLRLPGDEQEVSPSMGHPLGFPGLPRWLPRRSCPPT